jgi:hypothetical protein
MIVTEHSIRAIINTIPSIRINPTLIAKAKFHWGDEKELNRYVQLMKEDCYPLIWLLPSPDNYEGNFGSEVQKQCSFIIATRETRIELFNDQRYIKSFDLVLQPLTEFLIKGLTNSNITSRIGDGWEIIKYPNYSADSPRNGTIDLWDAISLSIDVRFKNNITSLTTINYGD